MESTYDVGDALIEIEDMIGGEAVGNADKPSIYKISREQGLCSESLYHFVLNLITEGTALEFIYLEMVGQTVPESLKTQLKERILLNERMYLKYCSKYFDKTCNFLIQTINESISTEAFSAGT